MIDLNNYPKSKEKFKETVAKIFEKWFGEMGQFAENLEGETLESAIPGILQSNERILYDFLDENFIHLQPMLLEQLNPEAGWGFELSFPSGSSDENGKFSSRKEAEHAGFEKGLTKLEELL